MARKIAATFSSVGLVSLYLNPLDALHGDLGVVAPGDVVILLSNSGETQEIVAMISHLRLRKTQLIAIVGKVDSAIGKGCDVAIDAGVETEAGAAQHCAHLKHHSCYGHWRCAGNGVDATPQNNTR